MRGILATSNFFGPSTLVLISLLASLILLGIRTYVHESRLSAARSALLWLDTGVAAMMGIFLLLVYLRFRYLA